MFSATYFYKHAIDLTSSSSLSLVLMSFSDLLGLNVIKDHFGHFVWLVSDVLLTGGKQTLGELVKNVKTRKTSNGGMPNPALMAVGVDIEGGAQVQNALVVLLQHDLVGMELSTRKVTGTSIIVYRLLAQNAIRRMRYGTFISVARQKFGEEGACIIEELLSNGRMRMNSVVESIAHADSQQTFADDNDEGPSDLQLQPKRESVSATFQKMLEQRYITPQVPPLGEDQPLLFVDTRGAVAGPGEGTSGRQNGKDEKHVPAISGGFNPKDSSSDDDSAAASPRKRLRKRKRTDSGSAVDPPPTSSTKEGSAEGVEDNSRAGGDDAVIYVCGYEQFHRHLRNSELTKFVGDKFSPNKKIRAIVEAMLALTESSEDCACPSTSNAVAAKELERNLPDIGINFEMLLKYLQVLCCDQSKPISKVSEAGFGSSRSNNNVQFVVNIRNVVEWLKKKALDSIIREKFGKESARICKVLLDKKQMEQKQLGEIAMIPAKETKQYLYKMMAARMVTYQEIPKKADRAPSQTFYCWSVNLPAMYRIVCEDLYRASLNLRLRRQHEMSDPAQKELVERIGDLDQSDGLEGAPLENNAAVDSAEKAKHEKLRGMLNGLDHAILRIDRTLMLFNDFS